MGKATIRWRIESLFERWGRFTARHPYPVLAIMLAVSLFCISNLRNLEMDTSIEGFLPKDDPVLVTLTEFRRDFGSDDRALIAIRSNEIFSFEFLEKLRAFHRDLEENVLHLDKIDSLINARSTRGAEGELIVEDLFEVWPENEAALFRLRDQALANPLYTNFLLSESGTLAAISIRFNTYSPSDGDELLGFEEQAPQGGDVSEHQAFLTGDEIVEAVASVREVMKRHEGPDFPVHLAGGVVMEERLRDVMGTDMGRFLGLSILAAAIILFVLFRRISGALLPVAIVLLSLLATLGMAPWFDIPIQMTMQVLPSFLLAVGVGDSVHILTIFYQRLLAGDAKEDAIAAALGHSGFAVLMTSVTTAGALLSFTSAALASVKDLGILAPVGIMFALVYTLTILPAMLSLLPIAAKSRNNAQFAIVDRTLMGCANISTQHPWTVVGAALAILTGALLAAAQVRFSHDPVAWFPEEDAFRISMDLLNDELGGGVTIEVLFESDQENRLHDPAVLAKMEALQKYNETLNYDGIVIGDSISIVDILKEINQALNENRSEYRRIPDNRQLIAQELLLFENSGTDDLADFSDSLFSTGRMTLRVPQADAIKYAPMLRQIEREYSERMGAGTSVKITGLMPLLTRTFEAMILSMMSSYILAFVIITPLMMMFLASFRLGALSMFPNLLPIVITLGVMGIFDFPIDGFSVLIGSIALGLAVDDTIHFMHGFNRYYAISGDSAEAVRSTLATSGQAMLVTTLVLCSGFMVFTAGYLSNVFDFGLLTATSLALAFVGNVLLAPALMVLATRSRKSIPAVG